MTSSTPRSSSRGGQTRSQRQAVLAMKSPKKRVYYTQTQDGWRIALHRYRGESRYPVLMVHGLASNHTNFDFPVEEQNFARYLNSKGFDCWIIDLRGSGLSKKLSFPPKKWVFDHYVFQDLPAAVKKILKVTKAGKIHWVGHSLGGLLAFPFFQNCNHEGVIKSLTTIATPITTSSRPGYFKYLYPLDSFIKLMPTVPYALLSKLAALFHRPLLKLDDHVLYARANMDETIIKHLLNYSVESVPSSLITQIHDWIRQDRCFSHDGKLDFFDDLSNIDIPVLMVVGSIDSFTPQAALRLASRKFPKGKLTLKVFGKHKGHRSDYGHVDLILGKHAPLEVFPQLSRWLKRQDR